MLISVCTLRDVGAQLPEQDLLILSTASDDVHYQLIPELQVRDPSLLHYVGVGNLRIIQLLASRAPLTKDQQTSAFETALVNGHLDVAKWLMTRYELEVKCDLFYRPNLLGKIVRHPDLYMWLHPPMKVCDGLIDCNHFAFQCAAVDGHLQTCQCLAPLIEQTTYEIVHRFFLAAKYGHLDVCQWFAAHYSLTSANVSNVEKAYIDAAENGHLSVCKWLVSHFQLTRDVLTSSNKEAVAFCAAYGYLDLFQWLVSYFGMSDNDIAHTEGGTINALQLAASYGQLAMCEWIASHFPETTHRCRPDDSFCISCIQGHLNTLQWLTTHFDGVLQFNYEGFYYAAKTGHLNVCHFLTDHFGLTRNDVFPYIAIKFAGEHGHLVVCQYLIARFGLTGKDFREVEHLREAAQYSKPAVYKWLSSRFDL